MREKTLYALINNLPQLKVECFKSPQWNPQLGSSVEINTIDKPFWTPLMRL